MIRMLDDARMDNNSVNKIQFPTPSCFGSVLSAADFKAITTTEPWSKQTPWLSIHFKILSITYKALQSHNPSHLHNLLQVQSYTSTRSSASITLTRPAISSRLKIIQQIIHSPGTCSSEHSS